MTLTRDDIMRMEAGPEMDRRVAEEVMGWRLVYVRGWDNGTFLGGHYDSRLSCELACRQLQPRDGEKASPYPRWSASEGNTHCFANDWSPSTDIKAAWEVVEALARKGYTMRIEWKGAGRMYELTAEVSVSRDVNTSAHVVGETVPAAICMAALAVLAESEQQE